MIKKLLNDLAIEETDSAEDIQRKGIYAAMIGLRLVCILGSIVVLASWLS